MESLKIIPNIKSLLENNREDDAVEIINKYIDSISYYLKDVLHYFKAETESSALCLSKIHLILQNYEKSIEYAVKSGSLFVNDGSFYFRTLIGRMMDLLIKDSQHPCRKFVIEMIQKDVLSDSYIGFLYTIKEYERFEFCFKIYLESYDRPKDFLRFILRTAEENNDKKRIHKAIASLEEEKKEAIFEHPTVYFLIDSLVYLGRHSKIQEIISRLGKGNITLCYDLCFYLQENYYKKGIDIKVDNADMKVYNADITNNVIDNNDLTNDLTNNVTNNVNNDLTNNINNDFNNNTHNNTMVSSILSGEFKRDLLQRFLTSNNLTSFRLLDSIAKTRSPHVGFVNALMNLGSTNDTFYRSNSDLLSTSKDWSKFNDVAYLGMIHLNNNLPYEVLKNYLPSEISNKEGGALYALGLINRCSYNEEDNEFILFFLESVTDLTNEIALGACLGVGLINLASNNKTIIDKLLSLSKSDNTIISESAVYGLGLVALGSSNESLMKELEILLEETEFERVKRTIGLSYSLIMARNDVECENSEVKECENSKGKECENNEVSEGNEHNITNTHPNNDILITKLCNSKDAISRFGGVLCLGSSYVGSGRLEIISQLLDFLNDGDDDVKRATVISISLVCCDDQDLLISTLEPLSENHNFFVRAIVALCLGFFNAGTGNKTCCDIVEALIHDSNNLVRQSAYIGMGFLIMQCNPTLVPNYRRIVDTMNRIIVDRCEEPCVKHGAVIGRGISEAGGRNIIFSIRNMHNKITLERVAGAILYLNHWYWYPLMPMLALNYLPTPFYVFDENLNEVKQSLKYTGNYDNHLIRLPDVKRSRGFKAKVSEDKEVITKAHPEVETGTRCTMLQQEDCGIELPGVFFTSTKK